jgi:hypothetical protein
MPQNRSLQNSGGFEAIIVSLGHRRAHHTFQVSREQGHILLRHWYIPQPGVCQTVRPGCLPRLSSPKLYQKCNGCLPQNLDLMTVPCQLLGARSASVNTDLRSGLQLAFPMTGW